MDLFLFISILISIIILIYILILMIRVMKEEKHMAELETHKLDKEFVDTHETTIGKTRRCDKEVFVRNLGILLSQTNEGIIGCELKDVDTVTMTYSDGRTVDINIALDSYSAIVKDVAMSIYMN